jgi:hypothetical protein
VKYLISGLTAELGLSLTRRGFSEGWFSQLTTLSSLKYTSDHPYLNVFCAKAVGVPWTAKTSSLVEPTVKYGSSFFEVGWLSFVLLASAGCLVGLAGLEGEELVPANSPGANGTDTCGALLGVNILLSKEALLTVAFVFGSVPPEGQKYLARETPPIMTTYRKRRFHPDDVCGTETLVEAPGCGLGTAGAGGTEALLVD